MKYTAIGDDVGSIGEITIEAATDEEAAALAREWVEGSEWSAEWVPVRVRCGERLVTRFRVRTTEEP